jgi:hypothetical protein
MRAMGSAAAAGDPRAARDRSPRRRVRRLLFAFLAVAAAALLYPVPPLPVRTPPAPPGPAPAFSLLAIGDTGEGRAIPALRSGQLAVARALVEADLARPANALLLLGDNFYPSGLEARELVERVRANLVTPYCRFVDLSGPRSPEVADACRLPRELRRAAPIPILAILGNHDHKAPESPALQRDALPAFVRNWQLAESPVSLRELAPGLSLVLVDTPAIAGDADALRVREVISRAPGPWRVVAVHEPFAAPTAPVPWRSNELLRRALRGLEVPVQLVLTGHNHALQAAEVRDPFAALHLMVGAGSTDRVIDERYEGEVLSLSRTGFARIDWLGTSATSAEPPRSIPRELEVTVFEAARYPVIFFLGPRSVARWRIGIDGRFERLPLAP